MKTEKNNQTKIKNNFLVVSNYNNDTSWTPSYTNDYIIYDRSDDNKYTKNIDRQKIIKTRNIGYNLYDYFTFIIDNYENLPKTTIFVKGNIFPRHVTQEYFNKIINNQYFTPIEDYRMHKEKWPAGLFSADGGFCQINQDQYLENLDLKYFFSYNDFLKFCFKDPLLPRYLRFAPGGNYIVPKENILKLPKIFYENLRFLISYCELPGEAHIIERALYTIWMSNFDINEKMLSPIDENTIFPKPRPKKFSKIKKTIPNSIKKILIKIRNKFSY